MSVTAGAVLSGMVIRRTPPPVRGLLITVTIPQSEGAGTVPAWLSFCSHASYEKVCLSHLIKKVNFNSKLRLLTVATVFNLVRITLRVHTITGIMQCTWFGVRVRCDALYLLHLCTSWRKISWNFINFLFHFIKTFLWHLYPRCAKVATRTFAHNTRFAAAQLPARNDIETTSRLYCSTALQISLSYNARTERLIRTELSLETESKV